MNHQQWYEAIHKFKNIFGARTLPMTPAMPMMAIPLVAPPVTPASQISKDLTCLLTKPKDKDKHRKNELGKVKIKLI